MFCCGSQECEPPLIAKIIEAEQLIKILEEKFQLVDRDVYIPINRFGLFNLDDLKSFLASNFTKSLRVKSKERFGEHGYAESLLAKEKIWYSTCKRNLTTAFGIAYGDIHIGNTHMTSVNWCLDSQLGVWFICPYTLECLVVDSRTHITEIK